MAMNKGRPRVQTLERNYKKFFGVYRTFDITITREPDGYFYITVFSAETGFIYQDFWRGSVDMDEAISQALTGSGLVADTVTGPMNELSAEAQEVLDRWGDLPEATRGVWRELVVKGFRERLPDGSHDLTDKGWAVVEGQRRQRLKETAL
jgi:hypothetical protein